MFSDSSYIDQQPATRSTNISNDPAVQIAPRDREVEIPLVSLPVREEEVTS